jgi:Ca2+-binding RTX toxin-like protein
VDDILGTSRADLLRGTAGADVIRGLGGKDEIRGLQGNDTLYGDAGFDELFGGAGLDKLFGGANGDRFTFLQVGEAPARGPRYDEIMDFSRSEGDKINLRLIDADGATSGVNDTFRLIGTQALTGASQIRYEATDDGDFLVTGSVDADAAAEFAFIVRTELAELRGADFLL